MAFSKLVTFWPIQLYEVRRTMRESHALVLENAAEPLV
jgi:hypothetical protein